MSDPHRPEKMATKVAATKIIPTSSAFTKMVVNTMRKMYPESLADKSWDNTGLLLEAPVQPDRKQRNSVLLTVDLTRAVAEEAIRRQDSIIISYHPPIFRGLKALTIGNTQQTSLLRLVQEGISVYSPHTALDAVPAGVNDWLANVIMINPEGADKTKEEFGDLTAIKPLEGAEDLDEHFRSGGIGRLLSFSRPMLLSDIITRVKVGLDMDNIPIAIPQTSRISEMHIQSVGICAGSGSSVLKDVDADLYFTGEFSHHDALEAIEKGKAVIAPFHSNTERGFLRVMRDVLRERLSEEWKDAIEGANLDDEDEKVSVALSRKDCDPYLIV